MWPQNNNYYYYWSTMMTLHGLKIAPTTSSQHPLIYPESSPCPFLHTEQGIPSSCSHSHTLQFPSLRYFLELAINMGQWWGHWSFGYHQRSLCFNKEDVLFHPNTAATIAAPHHNLSTFKVRLITHDLYDLISCNQCIFIIYFMIIYSINSCLYNREDMTPCLDYFNAGVISPGPK